MPTSYTSLLGLALPVTGELSGTWGDTVNDYITQYLDASVAGTQTISGSQTAVTLSKTTATSLSQAGSGATGSSQYNIINCTGNPASMLTVTVPAASKTYVVVNATSTNQDVKIVGAGPTTGVTLVAGEKAVIAWNGSDFIKVATSTADGVTTLSFGSTGLTPSTATSGAVTVAGTLVAANGGTGQSSYTTGDLLYATGSTALSKLGIGTNGQILTSTGTAPQWSTLSGVAVTTFSAGTTGFTPSSATSGAVTLAGTLATTNGGTGLTSFTANGVVYASSSSALTTGSALTFDGTEFKVNAASGNVLIQPSNVANAKLYMRHGSIANNNGFEVDVSGNTIFLQAGSEAMRLTSTGLGIGTSSPTSILNIKTSNGQLLVQNGTSANQMRISAFNNAGNANAALIFEGYSSEYGRFDSSGNLGLGVVPTAYGDTPKLLIYGGASSTSPTIEVSQNGTGVAYHWQMRNGNGVVGWMGSDNTSFVFGTGTSTERARITSGGNLLVGTTTDPGGSGKICDANGNVRAIPQSGSAKTTSYTLATTDVGEYIQVGSGGSITIPDATFATGDVVSVFNNTTGNITITCSITTAYIAGTDSDKATMTLATRGVATILFISSTVCVVTGNVT